jgi:hypothetical protein
MNKTNTVPRSGQTLGGNNFLITVHHTKNNTWQGVIKWLDSGKTLHFRSALEMMTLMDQAIKMDSSGEEEVRTWQDTKQLNAI